MLTVGENTYITVAEADAIVATHLDEMDGLRLFWEGLKDADKKVYLTKGVEQMESIVLPGRKTNPMQAMNFPRFPSREVPKEIKLAQAYNALGFFNTDIKGAAAESMEIFKRFGVHFGAVDAENGAISGDTNTAKEFALESKKAAKILKKYRYGGYRMR